MSTSGGTQVIAIGRTVHGGTTDYSLPGVALTTNGSMTPAINTLTYTFHTTPTPITLDQLALNVTTGPVGAANARIGIWLADGSWQPFGTALVDSGSIAVGNGVTGIQTAAVAVVIPACRFIIALNQDNAMTYRSWTGFPAFGGIDSGLAGAGVVSGAVVNSAFGAMAAAVPWTTAQFAGAHGAVVRISVP